MEPEPDLQMIRDRLMESATNSGCNAVGVCNQEGLEGGPPSTDLTRQLKGARSAIVISYPVDEEKLELYMDVQRLQPGVPPGEEGPRKANEDVEARRSERAARGRQGRDDGARRRSRLPRCDAARTPRALREHRGLGRVGRAPEN